MISHISDNGQVTVRYYGLYASAHQHKVSKASREAFLLGMVEEGLWRLLARACAAMIRKVNEVDPMVCPRCGGRMRVIVFLIDHAVADRIIDHSKPTLVAERPPPPYFASQKLSMDSGTDAEYFL